jgi:hypothetical protein
LLHILCCLPLAWHSTSTCSTVRLHRPNPGACLISKPGEDEACVFTQKIPVTRLFLDDEYFLMGLADGTIKVYGTDRLNFITQINLSPGTIHPASMPTSISGMMVLPYKVSYLSRHREFVVSSALDIVHRQLEISVWGIRGQHSVYPLTSFLIPGNVSYVSYDPLQQVVITISQQKDPANPRESIGTLQKVKLDMKSLASSMSKWKSTNETNQFKLAYGLIDEVTLEPNFAKALMRVEMSASEAEVVAEAMHTILKDKPELLKTLIDSAILHELDTKHGLSDTTVVQPSNRFTKHRRRLSSDVRPPSGSNSVTSSVEHSNTDSSSDDSSVGSLGEKGQMSTVTSLTSMTSNSRHSTTSSDDQSSGSIESSYNYWIPGAVTSTILSHFMVNTLHVYAFVTLSDPLTLLAKSESKYAFAISSSTTPETHRMMKRLMKIVATIIDGLIKHESHFLMSALQVLVQYHNRLKLDHPDMTDDKAIKIGAGRLFITHFVLAAWLEPVKFRMTSKIGSGSVNNMYIVAKLLESICLGSRDELEGEDLTEFRTKYGKKFQAWFHSKVANPERHVERSSKKSRHASSSVSSNSKAALKSAANIRNASLIVSQFIIAHNDDLIQALNNPLPGSTASTQQIAANEPTIARIKVLSDNLLRPIVSLMATEGAKDNYLADRLQVFSDMYGDLSSVETVKLVSASFRHDLDMERRAHASRTGVMPSSPLSSPDRHVASTKARTREDLPSLSDLAGSPYSSSGGLGLEPSASLNALNDNPIRKVRYTTTRPDSSPRSLKQLASPTINKRPSSLRLKTKHLRHIESSSFELSDLPSPNSARSAPLSPPSGSSGISGPGKSSISSDSSRSPPSGSASARAVLSGVPASQLSIPAPHISTKSKTSPLM